VIRVTEVRQESLNRMISDEAYGKAEAALEGFPEWTGREFACFFTKTHSEGGRQLTFHKPITRIAFEYVD